MIWDNNIEKTSAAYRFASDDSKIIRVVAGPGTGKSFGLNRRVARLLEEGQDPKRILAVTFTRTAAQDLKNEIQSIGIIGAEKVVAKTLHSFCFGLLNKKDIIENTGRFPRPMLDYEQKPMLYDISDIHGDRRQKETRLLAFEAAWARLQSEEPGFPTNEEDRQFEKEIRDWLISHKSMLFGEMIIETYHYLNDNPLCAERREFDHILVDEYQDLNRAEQAVVDLLSGNGRLTIIGDDDQSIYSFKYANPDGIREFPATHPNCSDIDFDHCRRCPTQVVSMASRLISHNSNRTLGDLQPFESNQNGIITIVQWKSLSDEIIGITDKVKRDINSGTISPEDVLILTPVRKIGYRVRDALVNLGIKAKSYFRESAISNDGLKYNFSILTLLANPSDMVSLRFLLGYGNPTYRSASYKHLYDYCKQHNLSTIEALEKCASGILRIPHISSLVTQYNQIKKRLQTIKKALEEDADNLVDLLAPNIQENEDFRNILIEATKIAECEKCNGLLAWLKEVHNYCVEKISYPDNTAEKDHIRIMSLHSSKGLSAKYVIVMSAIDELIPHIDRESEISIDKQIEEQRRLFYVAITRCKSSKEGYPGSLIISSFVGLPGSDALGIGIQANAYNWRTTSASRFIREFEGTAPKVIVP